MAGLITPVHIAASYALKRYLELVIPDTVVEPKWPDPDKALPPRAITIIPAGPRHLYFMDYPQLISSEEINPNSNLKMYKWRLAECEQPFQLDVWASFPGDRDDICARLDLALNAGFSQLSNATIATPSLEPDLHLELSDGWEDQIAAYVFESTDYDDTPEQVLRKEYRATYSGMSYFNLTGKAIKPALAKVNLLLKLEGESDYQTFST